MREILFRGKRKDNGEWIEGHNILFIEQGRVFIIPTGSCIDDCESITGERVFIIPQIEVIPETVGQYTGLTDKNGKKIFEGDIVQYTDEEGYYPEDCCDFVGKIVLEHGAFGIATNDNIPIDLDNWCDNDNFVSLWELYWNLEPEGEMLSSIEVIGNIHDNPELQKGA